MFPPVKNYLLFSKFSVNNPSNPIMANLVPRLGNYTTTS